MTHTHKIQVNKENPRGVSIPYSKQEIDALHTVDVAWEADAVARNLQSVRENRNNLLAKSDNTQTNDRPDSTSKTEWKIYRQKLRDITEIDGNGNPTNPIELHKSWKKKVREADFPNIGDIPEDDGMWPLSPSEREAL
jgi:hypothetical protein